MKNHLNFRNVASNLCIETKISNEKLKVIVTKVFTKNDFTVYGRFIYLLYKIKVKKHH